jgi:hypothetical protein
MSETTEALEQASYAPKTNALVREPEMVAAERALVRGHDTPMPAFTGAEMSQALTAYRELQRALDASMPEQIMTLDGKPFRKKGYWRAIAVAFNLTVEPMPGSERREVTTRFDDGRENFGYVVTYRASTPNGRSTTGDGSAFAVEKARRFRCPHPERPGSARTLHFPAEACPDFDPAFQWKTLPAQATEHNIRSHAHTRAFNRAVSNLVGFGEVSAEEVERGEPVVPAGALVPDAPPLTNRAPAPAGYVYIFKYWKEYDWHHVLLPDANGGHTWALKTKVNAVGDVAAQAFQQGVPVQIVEKDGKWLNKITPYKAPPSNAELDAELARQEMARQAGEVL